jgi:hypothetical protein
VPAAAEAPRVADGSAISRPAPGQEERQKGGRPRSHTTHQSAAPRAARNGDATLRIAFGPNKDEWVDYPVPDNTSFSLDEAAGSTEGDDTILTVSDPTFSPGGGKLVGWFSAEAISGRVRCDLTQTP